MKLKDKIELATSSVLLSFFFQIFSMFAINLHNNRKWHINWLSILLLLLLLLVSTVQSPFIHSFIRSSSFSLVHVRKKLSKKIIYLTFHITSLLPIHIVLVLLIVRHHRIVIIVRLILRLPRHLVLLLQPSACVRKPRRHLRQRHLGDNGQHNFLALGRIRVLFVLVEPRFQGGRWLSGGIFPSGRQIVAGTIAAKAKRKTWMSDWSGTSLKVKNGHKSVCETPTAWSRAVPSLSSGVNANKPANDIGVIWFWGAIIQHETWISGSKAAQQSHSDEE